MDRTFSDPGPLKGRVKVPGDKAISHRALIVAAMRTGESRLTGIADGQDVASTAACIATLGARPTSGTSHVDVVGDGWRPRSGVTLDCGNSGSTMRMLMGPLAGRDGTWKMHGDPSLSRRPMERIAGPLRSMGATIQTESGTPPIQLTGGGLKGTRHELDVASAQVKTALLFAGLLAEGETTVLEPSRTRDHTERLLTWLGAPIRVEDRLIAIQGDESFVSGEGFKFDVPGDISSAAYLVAAAVLIRGSSLQVDSCGSNPTRTGFVDVFARMGANVSAELQAQDPEPIGTLRAHHSPLAATDVMGGEIPLCIDEIPLIAMLATQAEGTTRIADAAELRVKESDRLSAVADGLNAIGAKVIEIEDGLVIEGPTPLRGGSVDARGDHRIALTFAVAGLISSSPVTIRGFECSSVSYPTFERDLKALSS